jgi:hypothetical protein
MTQHLAAAWRSLIALIAIAGSVVLTDSVQAGHSSHRSCNPAAEAHMTTAIRLMDIACHKPIHASRALARAAVTHISLAQRFVRTPAADAELCVAKASLERFIHHHCAIRPFYGAMAQTQLALDLERSVCVCGMPSCGGACQLPLTDPMPPLPVQPAPLPQPAWYNGPAAQSPHGDFSPGYGHPIAPRYRDSGPLGSYGRDTRYRDRSDQRHDDWRRDYQQPARDYGQVLSLLSSLLR